MITVQQIADQLRATNYEHVRAVLEPDDVMVLLDYLEGQGFVAVGAEVAPETPSEPEAETPTKKGKK